jgi:hypothetical protein
MHASAAVVAIAATLASFSPARAAGCTPDDLVNDLQNEIGAITSGPCAAACADGGGCAVAAVIATTLAGVSSAGQGTVDKFCSTMKNLLASADKAQDNANSLENLLQQAGVSSDVLQTIIGGLADVASPIGAAACGCAVEQNFGNLGSDVGACIQDALCSLDALIGDPCNCTPPPPIRANCALPVDQNTIMRGPGITPTREVDGATGAFVSGGGDTDDGHGHCGPVIFCFCPKPLVPTWKVDPLLDSSGNIQVFFCACPSGTHQTGVVGGLPMCLCDNSNQPPNGPDSLFGMCPPPDCAKPQIKIGSKCVTPCADPTKGMTNDGSCCDPTQVTSCGMCCPPGTTPDPATASCVGPPQPPR